MCGRRAAVRLTQLADVFSELLEGRVQAFGVGGDFGGVQHEGHAVDLLPQARPLHVAESLRHVHRLVWTELIKEEERKEGLGWGFSWQRFLNSSSEPGGSSFSKVRSSRRFPGRPYLVSLGYKALNDRQEVMEGGSRHGSVPQAHAVTQHQASGLFSSQAQDFEEL